MYRLQTFGGLAIERNGTLLDQVGAHRKALSLLAVLAARGTIGREQLVAMLWPDSDAARAKGSLNQAIHLLRRQLDTPDLLLGTVELRLNPERIESDVGLFSRALAEGNPAAAVRHYRGSFLDGVHVFGTPDFEGWVEAQRADLEQRYMGALGQLARTAEAQAEYAEAAEWWRRLQSTDPPNSRVAVSLMLALESAGDRAAALQHAWRHEALLRDEWGMAPDPAFLAVAGRLQSSDPGRAPTRGSSVLPGRNDRVPAPGTKKHDSDADTSVGMPEDTAETTKRPGMRRPALLAFAVIIGIGGGVAALIGVGGRGISERSTERDGRAPFTAAPMIPTPARGSIAVLPFIDLSPEGDQEYFSDGMTEELITTLSMVDGLKVAGRTSAFQFKGSNPDIREVRERLRVSHVLEGSVRKAGDQLRITAQLINTDDGYHIWAETYERNLSDVFAVQEEISRAIVEALQVKFGSGADAPLFAVPTGDTDAYELYLKGLHFLNRLQIQQAIEHLAAAIEMDAQFARAYAALAVAYAVPAAYSDLSPVDSRGRGIAAAEAALRIDPLLADAHSAMGWLEMIGFHWDEAERALRRAIEIDPRSPRARFYYALFLHRRGQLDDAFAQIRHARELDPLSLPINSIYGLILGDLGFADQAVAHLEATLELDPSFPIAHTLLGHIHMGTGRTEEAIRHYERVAEIVSNSFYTGFLGHAYARAGRTSDARLLLSDLMARSERGEYVSPGAIGWILLGLGELDDGFRWLERAAVERDVFLAIYGVLTNKYLAETFQDDPRFDRIRTSIGLPP